MRHTDNTDFKNLPWQDGWDMPDPRPSRSHHSPRLKAQRARVTSTRLNVWHKPVQDPGSGLYSNIGLTKQTFGKLALSQGQVDM